MRFIFQHSRDIILFLLLFVGYFFFRLFLLNNLPIFTDEAIYVRWAQIALHDANWRFISLTDGKGPFFIWVMMIFIKFFHDPLIAGRLVSVSCGFFTLIGLSFVTFSLFRSKFAAYFVAILYICYPFAQVHDRMALYDSMIGAFSIWSLYVSILLIRKLRLDLAYTLGFLLGGGVLTKANAEFSAFSLPALFLLFDFHTKDRIRKIIKFIILAGFAVIISNILYSILRLSPLYGVIDEKTHTFIYPFSEWIHHPFLFFVGNLHGMIGWMIMYMKLPYIILLIFGIIQYKKFSKEKLLLLFYFVFPFVALALFGKILFPRFIFFMSLMLLPICAFGLEQIILFIQKRIKAKIQQLAVGIIVVLIFILPSAYTSLQFAYDPIHAEIADIDRNQYVNGWPAGWGVKETVAYLQEQAASQKIFVGTEGTFGLLPESFEMYLVDNPNVTIKGYWPVGDSIPKEVLAKASVMPTYFVFYQTQHPIMPDSQIELIFKKQAGNGTSYYRLYRVLPNKL